MADIGTTIVAGKTEVPYCNADRLLLEFFVYADNPPGQQAQTLSPQMSIPTQNLPPKVASVVNTEVQKNWECTAEINDPSGLRAQCWEAKNRHKIPHSCCAPTLIFRGSRMVFTDIALYMRLDFLNRPGDFADICFIADAAGSGLGDTIKSPAYGAKMAGMNWTGATEQRTFIASRNWTKFALIDESHSVQAPNVTDTSSFGLNLRLQVEIWAGPNGDWVNNFRQGWGVTSPLYEKAKQWARMQVTKLQHEYSPPRIYFTGHSLGGGVASAAAQDCGYKFHRNKKLSLRGLTFNAAGLHPNTVKPASLMQTPVFDYTVRDEILTTLQSRTSDMPLIGSILRIAKHKLPEAVTNITISNHPGKSPGGYVSPPVAASKGKPADPGIELPPAGQSLPHLWPLGSQTVFPSSPGHSLFPNLMRAGDVFSTSATVLELLQNLIQMIHDENAASAAQYRTQYAADQSNTWSMFQSARSKYDNVKMNSSFYYTAFNAYYQSMAPELNNLLTLFKYATAYHLIPTVAETYYGKV